MKRETSSSTTHGVGGLQLEERRTPSRKRGSDPIVSGVSVTARCRCSSRCGACASAVASSSSSLLQLLFFYTRLRLTFLLLLLLLLLQGLAAQEQLPVPLEPLCKVWVDAGPKVVSGDVRHRLQLREAELLRALPQRVEARPEDAAAHRFEVLTGEVLRICLRLQRLRIAA